MNSLMTMTQKGIISMCDKLVGHFPVCVDGIAASSNWLYQMLIHCCHAELGMYDNGYTYTGTATRSCLGGEWYMDTRELDVWVDPSSLAVGVVLYTDGTITEDACWLQPIKDTQHINVP